MDGKFRRVVAAGVLTATAGMLGARAAELEEVVVTAQKRVQSLQDVPLSVNAIDGDRIVQAAFGEIEDIQILVPNLTMTETGIGTQLSIRGIGSGINQGFEQSVGMFVDGIYHGRAQLARAPFLDLERVEVLRGPQSILFGKNAIAGAISMTTAKPTYEPEASITAFYEPDDSAVEFRGHVSGPFSDTLAGRIAFLVTENDGYFENTTLGEGEPAETERVIRGTLQWEPTSNFSATGMVELGQFDAEGRFLEVVNPVERPGGIPYSAVLANPAFDTILETDQNFRRQSNGDSSQNTTRKGVLTLEYEFDSGLTLTSVTGYNSYTYSEFCDCDFTGAVIFDADTAEDFDQYSQELRIASPTGGLIEYLAGFYYQSANLDFSDSINVPTNSLLPLALAGSFPPPAVPALLSQVPGSSTKRTFEQESDLWALFFQATWNVTDAVRLTFGGRYTSESKDASRRQFHVDNTGSEDSSPAVTGLLQNVYGIFLIEEYDTIFGSVTEKEFLPRVIGQWDVTENAMAYASYSEGFKASGFDVRSNASPDPADGIPGLDGVFGFGPEEAKSYEVGAKFTLLDNSLEANVALYRTEYTDLQVSQFDGVLGFNVLNAAEATVQGLEFDARWQATEDLYFVANFAYLDFEFDSFADSQCDFFRTYPVTDPVRGLCDVSGERREFTPEYSGAVSGYHTYYLPGDLQLNTNLDLVFSDEYFASPTLDENLVQDAYVQLNARIGIGSQDGRWEVAFVGRNLTNQEILTFGNTLPVASALTGGTGNAYYAFYQHDRLLGVQATFNY